MDEISLDLVFESGLYGVMLDIKFEKNNKQFGFRFVEEIEESSKSGK